MGSPWSSAMLALALLAAAAPAQARHPCLGTVVDADGKALGGAAVTLVWSPGAGMPGEPDVVQSTTDERGRFKADIVVGHAYSAWAIGPEAPDGARLVSEVTDRAAAGRVIELAAWHPWWPRKLRCTGFEPWTGGAQPRLQLLPDARHHLAVALPAAKDGSVELPPTPWAAAGIGLVDDAGIAQVQLLDPDADTVAFDGRYEVAVKVADEKGRPLANAAVEHVAQMPTEQIRKGDGVFVAASTPRWHTAAKTDTDGLATFAVPAIKGHLDILGWLRATTPAGTFVHAPVLTAARAKAFGQPDGPLVLRARPVRPLSGKVAGVRADEVALLGLDASSQSSTRDGWSWQFALPVTLDAQGVLGCPSMPAAFWSGSLVMHLMPTAKGTPRYAFVNVALASGQLPDLDLAKLRALRIAAVDARNNPLPGCEVALFRTTDESGGVDHVSPLVLDAAGRADVLLDGSEWSVYATDGAAHAIAFVDAGRDGSDLRLQLAPMPMMHLRVVDGSGKAVRGASTLVYGFGFGSNAGDAHHHAKERIATRVALLSNGAGRSDAEGRIAVPVQDWRRMDDAKLRVHAGALQSELIPLVAGDEEHTVVVR